MYHSAKPGVNRFQSTPGFKAGRYARCPAQEMSVHGFNPLPALRPGDTDGCRQRGVHHAVSIHSRL